MLTARQFIHYRLQLHVRCRRCGTVTALDLERIAKLWPMRDLLAEKTFRCSRWPCRGDGVPHIIAPATTDPYATQPLQRKDIPDEKRLPYALELWSEDGKAPYETLARAVDSRLIRAAFDEAQKTTHPGKPLLMRQGTRVEGEANWPANPEPEPGPPAPEPVKGRKRRWK